MIIKKQNKIYFCGSEKKFEEIKIVIPFLERIEVDLPEIQEIDPRKIILAKLKEAMSRYSVELIVEDTSLYFEAMNGLPGPLIKWFMKTIGNEGLFRLAKSLESQKATAKTIIGYTGKNGKVIFFEGIIDGQIVKPTIESSFGWDPIFLPDGHSKTFAEMSKEEKNDISMRGKAAQKLLQHILKGKGGSI